jgi:hypothetical protein
MLMRLAMSMLVTVSEQAGRSQSQRKASVMTALSAKSVFAGTASCSASQTSLLSTASVSAICALQMAKILISVSVLAQAFARCDPRRGERRASRRCRSSPA